MKGLTIFILLISILSCKLENNELVKRPDFSLKGLSFTVSTKKDTTLVTEQGTILKIFPDSFEKNQQDSVIVTLTEYYSIPNMVLSNLSTTTKNNLLETGGMFNLKVESFDNNTISLSDKGISLSVPRKSRSSEMHLFYGDRKENDLIQWKFADDNGTYDSDTIPIREKNKLYDVFNVTKLGWINCDGFINFDNNIDLILNVGIDKESAIYCVVLNDYNSIVAGVPHGNGKFIFRNVPSNISVSIIGVGKTEDKMIYGIMSTITNEPEINFVNWQKTTLPQLKLKFEKRFGENIWSKN